MFLMRVDELALQGQPYQRLTEIQVHQQFFQREQSFRSDQERMALNRCRERLDQGRLCMVVQDYSGFTLWCQQDGVSPLRVLLSPEGRLKLYRGLDIQDRRFRLTVYPQCFVGSEAVLWLKATFGINTTEAVQLGQHLINHGVFHHVVDDQPFRDGFFYYRFYQDEPASRL